MDLKVKKFFFLVLIFCFSVSFQSFSIVDEICNEPDSAWIFAYATEKNANHNGLHFAWSRDLKDWYPVGPEYTFVSCDYGRWGIEKRMLTPFLIKGQPGIWHAIWSVNEKDGVLAHASSSDLVKWKPQDYPEIIEKNNCFLPQAFYDKTSGNYCIKWVSNSQGMRKEVYETTTKDFKNYTQAKKIKDKDFQCLRNSFKISGNQETGTLHKVSWDEVQHLIQTVQLASYKRTLMSEEAKDDPIRFTSLTPVKASLTFDPEAAKPISNLLIGIFFEDISHAADGGLYAELVQNRGFEYALSDKEGRDPEWNSYKAWQLNNNNATFIIDTVEPIHPNNKHYAVLTISQPGTGLQNEGFGGITLKAGEKYDFSVFARSLDGNKGKIKVRLIGEDGKVYGKAITKTISSEWRKYDTTITATSTVENTKLEVIPEWTGKIALDMISLFPKNTFKGRKNGLRKDLAETLAAMNPKFVRFPGGCVAHGDGLDNMYLWQNTVGPVETRKPQRNLWGYHQTAGLGYYEDFQFCKDIGAEPVPVVPAAVPCQNSATGGAGQQGGIPMCEMDEYIQSLFDLVEWANGDKKTKWGKVRAEAGHPEPFNMKYLGIGNEDLISDVFVERFEMIYKAFQEKHPEIIVIGTVGPFYEGSDYEAGWELATRLNIPIIDEHYYLPPAWYIYNQDYYDRYDRSKAKVYLGEYAAHVPGRHNNIETALAEAIHITAMERNGDVVEMSSYAPLLAKEGLVNWNPDLIYFNNTEVKPTVGYYIQQLSGLNSGDNYLPVELFVSNTNEKVRKRIAASVVKDSKSNAVIIKLVNMLPVSVDLTVDTSSLSQENNKVTKYLLHGSPDDKTATPTETTVNITDITNSSLPAYSFTVYRIQSE